MQKISTHLWYDKEAREAAELYVSAFPGSKILSVTRLPGTPSGTAEIVNAEIAGQPFTLLSAGPYFKFTPAISFLVACESAAEVDRLWGILAPGGKVLMELGTYPFAARYGWTTDKYGLSWQIMHRADQPSTPKITPTLMFVGAVCGRAEEAIAHYGSVFHDHAIDHVMRYEAADAPDVAGTVRHAGFTLEGVAFAAMDSAYKHEFGFNEAVSFMVHCKDQAEIDHYWQLSANPAAEQCGWLKDKFGVSWQIVPDAMETMMRDGTPEQMKRVTESFLKMKKFDLAELERAYRG